MSGASNDGLVQSLQLTVWPDDITSWRWVDRAPDARAREAYERVFRDLQALKLRSDGQPAVLKFTPSAQAMFREWMEDLQTEARGGGLPSTLESHLLKMPKTVASLALIFELIDGGLQAVGERATLMALGWAEYLRSHGNRLYAAGQTMAEEGARLIVERRHQLPAEFTARHVHQKGWASLADRDAVAAAIEMLIATNHCREVPAPTTPAGGRPTTTYVWHPKLVREGQ
jgi:hypothetical protein